MINDTATEHHGLPTSYMAPRYKMLMNMTSNGRKMMHMRHYLPSFREGESEVQRCSNDVLNIK